MFGKVKIKNFLNGLVIIEKHKFKITCSKDRKKAQKKITKIAKSHNINHTSHEYDRALGNAIHHGSLPVKCVVYIAKSGQMLCVIKDKGHGFDYRDVIQKFNDKKVYYHHHGYGFRCYARNDRLLVDWKKHGRKIVLYYF